MTLERLQGVDRRRIGLIGDCRQQTSRTLKAGLCISDFRIGIGVAGCNGLVDREEAIDAFPKAGL